MELPGLAKILEQFGAAPVSTSVERCLRRRHKDAACRLCLEACPVQAIVDNDPVTLEIERCLGCGLCLHLCPTGVFEQSSKEEDRLLTVLASLTDGHLELVCPRQTEGVSRVETTHIVQTKRCLAALSLPLLLDIAAQSDSVQQGKEKEASGPRQIWLNDQLCVQCPLGAVHAYIDQTVGLANYLLSIFGRQASFFTYQRQPEMLGEPRERSVVQGDEPRYSRRDFFGSLRQTARETAAVVLIETLSQPQEEGPLPVEKRLPHRLPPGRRHLRRALAKLGEPAVAKVPAKSLPLAAVEIGEDCSACGLCARFCPTSALTFAADEAHFVLNFTALDCLDCAICSLICPEGTVTFADQVETHLLVDPSPKPLLAGQLISCTRCGTLVAARGDEAPCFVCRRRPAGFSLVGLG